MQGLCGGVSSQLGELSKVFGVELPFPSTLGLDLTWVSPRRLSPASAQGPQGRVGARMGSR